MKMLNIDKNGSVDNGQGRIEERSYHVYNVPDHLIVFIRFYQLDALHFSGMILVENLGYSTPVLSLNLFPVKSYSPSLRRVKHYQIQDFEVFFFRLCSLQLLCQVEILPLNQRNPSWEKRLLSVLSTGKNS